MAFICDTAHIQAELVLSKMGLSKYNINMCYVSGDRNADGKITLKEFRSLMIQSQKMPGQCRALPFLFSNTYPPFSAPTQACSDLSDPAIEVANVEPSESSRSNPRCCNGNGTKALAPCSEVCDSL